jgi:CRISPR-associated protein Csd2
MTKTSTTSATGSADVLAQKIDFAVAFRVRGANPNGDPLNGNEPRTFGDEGLGEMTDVAIKRKMRDRLLEAGLPIFVQSDDRRTDNFRSLRERLEAVVDIGQAPDAVAKAACSQWFDVRAFGQLLALKAKPKAKKAVKGKAAPESVEDASSEGEDGSISIGVRGPVSVQHALSREPVTIVSTQITKSVNAEGDGSKRSSDTMGMKHLVEDGVYVFYGAINPQLAERTGFTKADADSIKAVLPRLFENDVSSARPEGSMEVLDVAWVEHSSKLGAMSSAKVHRAMMFDTARGKFTLPSADGLKAENIPGF